MIKFLFKGLMRDRHRSLLPLLVVIGGVMLTVFLNCWIKGVMGDLLNYNARFSAGHVKVMTRAYAEKAEQVPNDLALISSGSLVEDLNRQFPDMEWIERIRFVGLIDAPDENGETRAQGPAMGWGVDLLSGQSDEADRLNIASSLVRGKLPEQQGQVLISEQFARNIKVEPGQKITLVGSTMMGGLAIYNFHISGTVQFGTAALDRGSIIADISDVRMALDMQDATAEILGYFREGTYDNDLAALHTQKFNSGYSDDQDPFAPVMKTLKEQMGAGGFMEFMDKMAGLIISVFILAMSLVLWNAGLLGGLRRYGEVGVRLAMGESKGHVYRSMLGESVLIGIIGSFAGTILGLLVSYALQENGIDLSGMMKNSSMMLPTTFRAEVTPSAYYIGFVPGLFATIIGTALAGIGIYKRKTAQLFKELQ